MEINIGSNIIRNTNGVLNVEGKDQVSLEVREDGQLLVTMDVYDDAGKHTARLRRNAWTSIVTSSCAVFSAFKPPLLRAHKTDHPILLLLWHQARTHTSPDRDRVRPSSVPTCLAALAD